MAGAPSVIASSSTTMGVRRTRHHRFAGVPCSGSSQSVRAARLRPAQGLAAHLCAARFASCWNSRRLRRGLGRFPPAQVHSRSSHPLRFDIRPHWPQCPPVATRCFAWCRSPLRALRVEPTGFMSSGLRWPAGTTAAAAPRSRCALRAVAWVPSLGFVFRVFSKSLRAAFSQWPAAKHHLQPPPTPGSTPLRGAAPRGCPIRPPRGLPSPRSSP